jgi:hypothetical protein
MGPMATYITLIPFCNVRKEAPLVYWTLRIVVVFRIRKEAPLVNWILRTVVVFRIRKEAPLSYSEYYNYPQSPID